jgi:uncharacterized protein YyaL (SSP411 family)
MLRIFFTVLYTVLMAGGPAWHYDLTEAEQIAKKDHRHILLNFSGSDWCGPCIRMRKEIFEDPTFVAMADSSLVLVNADFPRMKRNQLPARQQALNNGMADRFNPQGKFPLTVLMTADGRVLREWDGYPDMEAADFAAEVRRVMNGDR